MGRRRAPGRREPNGRLSRTDREDGTDELRKQRERLTDGKIRFDDPRIKDPLLGYTLGLLQVSGEITDEECDAGTVYAGLHGRVWGLRSARSNIPGLAGSGLVPPGSRIVDTAFRAGKRYEAALATADGALGINRDVVAKVAIFEEAPLKTELPRLRCGLDELQRLFGKRLVRGLPNLTANIMRGTENGQTEKRW